jgi:hypothetical protein
MTNDEELSPEIELALAAFRWIKGRVMMENGESALVTYASAPLHPTVYQTTITDEEVLLSGGRPTPVPGFRITLDANGPSGQSVTLNGSPLGGEDYSFTYMMTDDLLHLALSVGADTCRGHDGLYRMARIVFTPSGGTFTGRISQCCPVRPVTYKWEGAVVPGA